MANKKITQKHEEIYLHIKKSTIVRWSIRLILTLFLGYILASMGYVILEFDDLSISSDSYWYAPGLFLALLLIFCYVVGAWIGTTDKNWCY